jgi:hypothetical protein
VPGASDPASAHHVLDAATAPQHGSSRPGIRSDPAAATYGFAAAACEVTVRRRDNANGAGTKSLTAYTLSVSADLVRLFADYLQTEHGIWTATTCPSAGGGVGTGIH